MIYNNKSGTLGKFNVALAASAGLLLPVGLQIDALIAAGIGPFQVNLGVQLQTALAASAGISIQLADPFAGLRRILAALANLQAAILAALAFPPLPSVQLNARLSAMAALSGTLGVQLGALNLAIEVALRLKLAALKLAAQIAESINAGPVFFIDFGGPLAQVAAEISALLAGGLVDSTVSPPNVILPGQQTYGLLLIGDVSIQGALSAIIKAA